MPLVARLVLVHMLVDSLGFDINTFTRSLNDITGFTPVQRTAPPADSYHGDPLGPDPRHELTAEFTPVA